MKIFLLSFAILVRIVCAGQSTTIDTTCVFSFKLQEVYAAASQKPLLLEKIAHLNEDIENYNLAITSLKMALNATAQKDSAMQIGYNREILVLNSQKEDYNRRIEKLEKQLRRSNNGIKIVGTFGICATIASILLSILK